MAYRADIEIAVRGARELDQTIKTINKLNNSINVVNRNAKLLQGKNFNVANIENYSRAVSKAERAVRRAAEGTELERRAISQLVSAMELENKARQRKNILIAQEVANRRRIQATVNAGFGIQGPQAAPIRVGRGPTSPIGGATFIPGSPAALRAAARGKTDGGGGGGGGRFGDIASNAIIGGAFPLLFGQGGGAATGGAIGGLIGGAFGGTGGFAGSLLGTLLGERVGRANQVKELAADIGFTAKQTQTLSQAFQQAGADFDKFQQSVSRIQGLGLSIEDQAKAIQLASALTEAYGGKIDKVTNAFTNALQTGKVTQATLNQLTSQGIPIQEALAQKYDISRTKLLQMAKDGQISVQTLIDTLVEIGNKGVTEANKTPDAFEQGFNQIEQALGELYQTFITVFDDTANVISESTGKGVAGALAYIRDFIKGVEILVQTVGPLLDSVASSYLNIQTAIGSAVGAVPGLTSAVLQFISAVTPGLGFVAGAIDAIRGVGAQRSERQGPYVPSRLQQKPLSTFTAPAQTPPSAGAKVKKSPENRTAQLTEELRALISIGQAEDRIRDLRFQGRDILAAQAEFDKQIADIQRDKNKSLMQANYESERIVINKIAEARAVKATLELEDQIREITRKRNQDQIEFQLRREQNRRQLEADIAGLTPPAVRSPLEQLTIDQAARRQTLLGPRLEELDQLQTKLAAPTGTFDTRQISEFRDRLSDVNDEIAQVTNALVQIDAAEIAWERNRAGVQALEDSLNAIGSSLTNVFSSLITGTNDWNNVLVNTLNSLSNILLQLGLSSLAGDDGRGFFSFLTGGLKLGKRAAGGPVSAGAPYIVGERGPELFVPGRSGTIVPNNAMGGTTSVIVNVDAKGTRAEGDSGIANQLGKVVAAAVKAEIVKEQRPGGLLANTRR